MELIIAILVLLVAPINAQARVIEIPKEQYLRYEVQGTLNDELATYAYTSCIDKLGTGDGKYSCKNRVKTINAESRSRYTGTVSKTNDHGIVQLHYIRHKNFINSNDFNDPRKQLDYGLEVWIDAKKKGVMPWYGFRQRHERGKSIRFTDYLN